LWGTSGYQATDAKGKVYGLLGLVEDINLRGEPFPINYSLIVEQVYSDTAKCIIATSEKLNILSFSPPLQPTGSSYNLPYWCPD
jgi:hypothetical protein